MKPINCFIPYNSPDITAQIASQLQASGLVAKIYLLICEDNATEIEGCELLPVNSLCSTETIRKIASRSDAAFSFIYTKDTSLELGQFALDRFYQIAESTQAGLVYSDYYQMADGIRSTHPVIDYQEGSLRDDFNFGSILFYNAAFLKKADALTTVNYQYAGLYNLRLKVSQYAPVIHIDECLYTEVETDTRKSGVKQFDYVDPKNRAVQIEMEAACTDHLKKTKGYLAPKFRNVTFNEQHFETEASVIIPVRNRVKTIEDAIRSVLKQKTEFKFNLIIVDNYSTDGTTELIAQYAKKDKRILHLIPQRKDLGIGGCWNEGVHHLECGKFSVQLDSDDVYEHTDTLQRIVNAFYEQNCAMVIGSYTMTNFDMQTIPPGLIDHKEWTPENGRNNALRINGLGAPRAFYTPVLRSIKVPNTSYGEDYALGLRISREYQIGRIYESLYLCRRWDDNSDASLDVVKVNGHNHYKDKIRTIELKARQRIIQERGE